VAAEEDEQKKGEGKGFAGLSSLVSAVDMTAPPAAQKETTGIPGASSSTGHSAPHNAQPKPQPHQAPSQPSFSSSGKWALGVLAVIGVIWFIGAPNEKHSSPAPAQPRVLSRPQAVMPPVGQGLVFSTAQITYCLAEDIRMSGAKSAVNKYSDSDVDRFNAMVVDYNSRCSSFRHQKGALESARQDIEPYRSQLYSEGRQRFVPYRPHSSISTPAQVYGSKTQSSATTQTYSLLPPSRPATTTLQLTNSQPGSREAAYST
jgi:hypothetical protein